MTISVANTIAESLAARLRTIRKSNGFHNDIGAKVCRGKTQQKTANFCTLYELEEDAGRATRQDPYTTTAVIHFVVESIVDCDPDNPDIAGQKAIADIQRALFAESETLNGLLLSPMQYAGRIIEPRPNGAVVARLFLDCTYALEIGVH